MNIQKMMKQAAKMQEQLNDALAEKTVAVSVGGEKVTVVANGLGDISLDQDCQGSRRSGRHRNAGGLDPERSKTSNRKGQELGAKRDGPTDFRARVTAWDAVAGQRTPRSSCQCLLSWRLAKGFFA